MLTGDRGAYVSTVGSGEVGVPATLQATIAVRIDRLDPAAKRTLSAAAVIGARFSRELLETLGIDPVLEDLVGGELIDQIRFTGQPEYAFHHPLIRTVADQAQSELDRVQMHRGDAAAIDPRDPDGADQNAALIAEHLEAAGDGHTAYGWHMRAASWVMNRDIVRHDSACSVPKRSPTPCLLMTRENGPCALLLEPCCAAAPGEPMSRRPVILLTNCGSCAHKPGDTASLAIAMVGLVLDYAYQAQMREASPLAAEAMALIESIDEPTLTVGLSVLLD